MNYKCGLENEEKLRETLFGKKLGLLTNHTGLDRNFVSTIDILQKQYNLVKLFAPEHGVRGDIQAGEAVSNYYDKETELLVVSLFRCKENISKYLDDIDCMVYDIQDINLRHFTHIYIMSDLMRECAKKGIEFVILDRYNPLGLNKISGNIFDNAYASAVGGYSLPVRYAMTVGEVASYINEEFNIGCRLSVIPCLGLTRNMTYRDLDIPWIPLSPNMPTYETALAYVGTVLFEGVNISEGRGTTKPFEVFGSPWLNQDIVIEEMKKKNLPGVAYRKMYFIPTFSKYKGELCKGIQLHITDEKEFEAYKCMLHLLSVIKNNHKELSFLKTSENRYFIDELAGTDVMRNEDFNPDAYIEAQQPHLKEFEKKSAKYYIYK